MGCDPAHWQCNVLVTPSNPHAVYVDPFFIDIHEVTVARYNACVLAGVCSLPSNTFSATRPDYFYNPDYVNFPVIYVDWSQAKTFCEWDGGRLPTEAEWEKAARGDQDNRLYAWGNDWIQCALANVTMGTYRCVGDTTMVASYPWGASPYGLKDMVGNTWEWVNDWFDINYYDYSPYNNPQGPDTGTGRIIRGGSWFGNQLDAVSSFRYGLDPNHIDEDLGFRCVVSP
jgi:formylglycine-generating enzyme required for sulfatase activity